MIKRGIVAFAAAVTLLLLSACAFAEETEAVGSEVNPLNMLLAVVYIIVVMALIYVILLCIDKLEKKNKKNDIPPDENGGDGEKDG